MKKNKISKVLFLIMIVFLFNNCNILTHKPHSITYVYTDNIYATIENNKINRKEISRNNINKMNEIIGEKYGIRFNRTYNTIEAPKMYNKDYDNKTQFAKDQYIKFYDDIKVTIGNKNFIIPKEEINLIDIEKEYPFYRYPAPIDMTNSLYNDVIVDLGTIEIYDETGKIQKNKRKIPTLLIKKTYYIEFYKSRGRRNVEVLYRGWAEDCPIELQK